MVMQRLTKFRMRRRREGQALVEFALIVPIFLLLVLGVFEFGRAWNVYQVLTDAAREGARVAVLANSKTAQQRADTASARINYNLSQAALDTAAAAKTYAGLGATGGETTVTIRYPYQLRWIQSFMGWTGLQASFSMNTSITVRNEE
jgi:Flp pilus assembly protein TadG